MPVASEEVWRILYTVFRYLFPLLTVIIVFLIFLFILSESHVRHESVRNLPGSGTVGELVVLSGSRDLEPNTWFPVPREGVLGSVRSCDLVIPCPGVRSKHLDFFWEDGLGLVLRLHTGCEALINGIPVDCRTEAESVRLTHGSVLQVGSAVLRLHLFAALDNTSPPVYSSVPTEAVNPPFSAPAPVPGPVQISGPIPYDGIVPDVPSNAVQAAVSEEVHTPRRSDRWKEDLGE